MSESNYEFFDHTGDFGVRIRAGSRAEAVALVARAFLDLLTDAPSSVAEREEVRIEVKGVDAEACVVELGNELLYRFEVEGFLCARFEPEVVEAGEIRGVAHGQRFDPERHPIARPMKAVTHHGVEFVEGHDGFRVRLVFDL